MENRKYKRRTNTFIRRRSAYHRIHRGRNAARMKRMTALGILDEDSQGKRPGQTLHEAGSSISPNYETRENLNPSEEGSESVGIPLDTKGNDILWNTPRKPDKNIRQKEPDRRQKYDRKQKDHPESRTVSTNEKKSTAKKAATGAVKTVASSTAWIAKSGIDTATHAASSAGEAATQADNKEVKESISVSGSVAKDSVSFTKTAAVTGIKGAKGTAKAVKSIRSKAEKREKTAEERIKRVKNAKLPRGKKGTLTKIRPARILRPITTGGKKAGNVGLRSGKGMISAGGSSAPGAEAAEEMTNQAERGIRIASSAVKMTIATAKLVIKAIMRLIRLIRRIITGLLTIGGMFSLMLIAVIGCVLLVWAATKPLKAAWKGVCLWFQDAFDSDGNYLYSEEDGDTLYTVMEELNKEFSDKILEIKNSNEHDEYELVGFQASWRDVFIVYGIESELAGEEDPAEMTEENKTILREVFWDMNEITYELTEMKEPAEANEGAVVLPVIEDDSDGEGGSEEPSDDSSDDSQEESEEEEPPGMKLTITIHSKTAREISEENGWDDEEIELMEEGLDEESDDFWSFIRSPGFDPENPFSPVHPEDEDDFDIDENGLVWPLQGYTHLSTYFGEPDAIYGRPHRGIDVPAPSGTSIHAVAGGVVIRSEWDDSWGNYVRIEHEGGYQTLYAHQTSRNVAAGDTVSAGQVIGFVGNTGDSLGAHLHLEWWASGGGSDLRDPMNYLTPG